MTKSRESGQNEITDEAKREAVRTKASMCDILASMLVQAKAANDIGRILKIIQAQKYEGCRNIQKRSQR